MRISLVLLLVACHSSTGGQSTGGDGGSGGMVTALSISPADAMVTLMPAGTAKWSGTASFTATATYVDGSMKDVTQLASWAAGDSAVAIDAGAATVNAPGKHPITAALGGMSANASLEATLTGTADATGFDAADQAKLDGTPSGGAPTLAYPLDGALFPANLAPVEIHVKKSDPSQAIARVRFSTPLLQLDYYAPCQASPNPGKFPDACIVTLSNAYVPNLVGASATDDVAISARLAAADGSQLAESASIKVGWADMSLSGGLYYWTTAGSGDTSFNTAVARYDFSGDTSMPTIYLSSADAPAVPNGQTQCIGCHALSTDGTKLAFSLGGSLPGYFSLFDVGSRTPIATRMVDKFVNMTTFSPDGTQMVNMAYGQLTLRTADAMLMTVQDNLFASTVNEKISHPFWSPDGRWLAFVSWVPGQFGAVDDEHVTGDMVQGGQIWLASAGATGFGTPQLLVPRNVAADGKSGYSYYYPAVSDDGEWVVFNRSSCSGPADPNTGDWGAGACDGYNDFSAQLMLVPTGGGAPIALDQANGAQTWTNSWPRFSPDHGQYRGRNLYWVAFSSRRDFGLSLAGSTDGSTKPQLWFAAVAPGGESMLDPSFAPVWLPGQDPDLTGPRGNHTPVWTSAAVPVK